MRCAFFGRFTLKRIGNRGESLRPGGKLLDFDNKVQGQKGGKTCGSPMIHLHRFNHESTFYVTELGPKKEQTR